VISFNYYNKISAKLQVKIIKTVLKEYELKKDVKIMNAAILSVKN
jgi:hypothetical protein